ncbi:MAG: GW dipeptide domain-containing protein [Pseudobdellovibrio sp.]
MQPTTDYKNIFTKALSLQQEGKTDEAIAAYVQILETQTNQATDLSPEQLSEVSYNLALAYFNKQDFAKSYIYNQKALLLDRGNKNALDFSSKIAGQFQVKTIAHDISLTENLNKLGFDKISFDLLWIITIIFLAIFIRNLFFHFVNRKKEIIDNKKLSDFANRNYLWLALGFIFVFFTSIKYTDLTTPKGLVKSEQLILKAAAGENQASLTDLPIGSLVEIIRQQTIDDKTYFQIKYPGGVSGWVKKDEIEPVILPKY